MKVKILKSYDYKEILKEIINKKPKVVFLDLMTNTGKINLIDLFSLIKKLNKIEFEEKFYLVTDITLTCDSFNPHQYKNYSNNNFHIISFESFNKYRQLGFDMLMSGGIIALREDITKIERSRRNTGQILYDHYAYLFPQYDRDVSLYRFNKISRNANIISQSLSKNKNLSKFIKVDYPLLKKNKGNYLIAKKITNCGGLVTFLFQNESLNTNNVFNRIISSLISSCKKIGISISDGVSFGFETPRISASASMAENTSSFLRLSCGPNYIHNVLILIKQLEITLLSYK